MKTDLNLMGESSKGASPAIIERYIVGDPLARAIVNAWAFRANRATVIKTVTPDEYRAMLQRAGVEL